MKIFMKRLLAVLSAVTSLLAIISLVLILLGYRPFVLESPSMEPLYRKGSLCWINTRVPLDSLAPGDVISYRSPADSLVLHRVVDVIDKNAENVVVHMQGDANNTVQEVALSRINYIGKEAFTIPGLGSIVSAISSIPLLVYGLIAVFIILACIPRKDKQSRKTATGGESALSQSAFR